MAILESVFSNPIVAFVLLVGVVVFVHELGHYLVGRALGIEVEEFSLGFGPKAVGFRRGNTDYRISWLPLGGYVRFYGSELGKDIPIEKREQSITTAKLHKRFLVSIAGPGANFVLSFFIMVGLSAWGLPNPPPAISVIPGSVAERAGFETGDVIQQIDDQNIRTWGDFNRIVTTSAGKELKVKVVRDGNVAVDIVVTPEANEIESVYGDKTQVGRIGVTQFMLTPRMVVEADSQQAKLGFQTGDKVVAWNGTPIRYVHQLQTEMKKTEGQPVRVELERPQTFSAGDFAASSSSKSENASSVVLTFDTWNSEEFGSFVTTDLMLAGFENLKVGDKQEPARFAFEACGLKAGHTLIGANGVSPLRNPVHLGIVLEKIQTQARSAQVSQVVIPFEILNAMGLRSQLNCTVPLREGRDHLNREQVFLDFPLRFVTRGVPVEPVILKSENALAAVEDGFKALGEQASAIFVGIKKLVSGSVPLANLGGPIAIARVAGDAAEGGLLVFILTISWMSVNIGMFNLLPLPALDGGTLLLQGVEAVYGRPLPNRVQEAVQNAGILIIIGLFVIVFYNDILRLFHS